MKIHMRQQHNVYNHNLDCDKCDKTFEKYITLYMHKKRTHEITFSCELCDYKTPGKLNLKNHLKSKHLNQIYLCKVCDYSGKNSRNLRAHEKTHAAIEDKRKCNYCDKKESDRSFNKYSEHIRVF